MIDFTNAESWLLRGFKSLLLEHDAASTASCLAGELVVKACGELAILRRVSRRKSSDALLASVDLMQIVARVSRSIHDDVKSSIILRHIAALEGRPDRSSFIHPLAEFSWEIRYCEEIAGNSSRDVAYWQQVAKRSLRAVLTAEDAHLRIAVYNFTHSVFFGSDFGMCPFSINTEVDLSALLRALARLLEDSEEWDLLYEVIAVQGIFGLLTKNETRRVLSGAIPAFQDADGWLWSEGRPRELTEASKALITYSFFHTTLAAILLRRICEIGPKSRSMRL